MSSTTENSEMQLPFPHGIEVELQVIRKDGTWIRGEDILRVFDQIISSAKSLLDKKIRASSVESVKTKYKQSAQTEEGERGSRIVVDYEDPTGNVKGYTILGHEEITHASNMDPIRQGGPRASDATGSCD